MTWRWRDPTGKTGPAEATLDLAKRAATTEARRRSGVRAPQYLDSDLQALLWASLTRSGWVVEGVGL